MRLLQYRDVVLCMLSTKCTNALCMGSTKCTNASVCSAGSVVATLSFRPCCAPVTIYRYGAVLCTDAIAWRLTCVSWHRYFRWCIDLLLEFPRSSVHSTAGERRPGAGTPPASLNGTCPFSDDVANRNEKIGCTLCSVRSARRPVYNVHAVRRSFVLTGVTCYPLSLLRTLWCTYRKF